MAVLNEDNLDQVIELVCPYVADLDYYKTWLKERLGIESEKIIAELECIYHEGSEESRLTDYRIIMNALKRI
jgi:hypothetical protein